MKKIVSWKKVAGALNKALELSSAHNAELEKENKKLRARNKWLAARLSLADATVDQRIAEGDL